ncbi:hypothetical protein V8C35DRAFT_280794 [Trichoderma chlorosporum]
MAPKNSPVISNAIPGASKEQPALRICFPLKIQRGQNSWWEYEEFRIQFRDRLMWRQAFHLDDEASPWSSIDEIVDLNEAESSTTGGNAASHNDGGSAFKSRWSSSTSSLSSALDHSSSNESHGSKTSSQRLMQLVTRLLSATSSRSNESSTSTREASQSSTSSSNYSLERHQTERHQTLHPQPLNLPSRQTHPSPDSEAEEENDADEIEHHRNVALRKLEGNYHTKNKYICFSTFRNMLRSHKTPAANVISPVPPALPPLRLRTSLQDQGAIRISSKEWANLRDDILGGLMGDTEAVFPFYTVSQKAVIMPVEQMENGFRAQVPPQREGILTSNLKGALERIEACNWKDVIFVSYDDTPREMKSWYTTREPRVLRWGMNMI